MRNKLFLILIVTSLFTFCSTEQNELRIAVAANAHFAMKDIITEYKKIYDMEVEVIVGSSGSLTAQIKNGAPYNIFLSADMKYPMELFSEDLTINKPSVYAKGNLVLCSLKENIKLDLNQLADDRIRNIAISNPETAPYGKAARQVLNQIGIYNELYDKLVYGENVSQTNQFILTKASEVGFTSLSSIYANRSLSDAQFILIDQNLYDPILQGAAIIKSNRNILPKAEKFFNFLFSDSARKIFVNHGYSIDYE